FQVFDGTQAVGGGVLRGLGATRPAAVFNLVGYYVVALPLALLAAKSFGMGLPGLWWGLCVGPAGVASALVWWIRRRAVLERTPEQADCARVDARRGARAWPIPRPGSGPGSRPAPRPVGVAGHARAAEHGLGLAEHLVA